MIATFVTRRSRASTWRASAPRSRRSRRSAGERNVLFDFRPKVHPQLMENYYTPGAKLEGRCLYPVSPRARVVLRQGLLLPVHPRRGRRPDDVVARGSVEWRAVRVDAQAAGRTTGSFRSAAAAAKWSCSPGAGRRQRPRASRPAAGHSADGGALTWRCSDRRHCSSIRRSSTASRSRGRAAARSARKCSARPSRPTRWRCSARCSATPAAKSA